MDAFKYRKGIFCFFVFFGGGEGEVDPFLFILT